MHLLDCKNLRDRKHMEKRLIYDDSYINKYIFNLINKLKIFNIIINND